MFVRLFAVGAITACAASMGTVPRAVRNGSSGFVDAGNGVRLFYQTVGAGRDTLIAIHGGPTFGLNDLHPDLDWLGGRHVVVFYDLRGTGRSTLPADTARLTMADHLRDLDAVVQHFHLQRPVLIGHSWGGVLAALFASEHPMVQRVLLLEPGAARPSMYDSAYVRRIGLRATPADSAAIRAARSAPQLAADPLASCRTIQRVFLRLSVGADSLVARVRTDWCSMAPAAFVYATRYTGPIGTRSISTADFRAKGGAIAAPVLIIAGSADPLPWASAAEWAHSIPDARLLLVAGAGHYAHAEILALVRPAIEQFLDGSWPVGAIRAPE